PRTPRTTSPTTESPRCPTSPPTRPARRPTSRGSPRERRPKRIERDSSLPPALRRDRLAVKPELVAPVFALERPDDVLLVGPDDVRFRLLGRDLAVRDRLVQLVTLGRGDVDQDLLAVAELFVQVAQVAL